MVLFITAKTENNINVSQQNDSVMEGPYIFTVYPLKTFNNMEKTLVIMLHEKARDKTI